MWKGAGVSHETRAAWPRAGVLGVVLVVSACSVEPSAVTESTPPTVVVEEAASDTIATTTTVSAPGIVEMTTGLPRSARYGFLEVVITGAALGKVEPRTFLDDVPVASEQNHVFLMLDLANLSERGDAANWPPTPFGLAVDGEPVGAPVLLDGRPHVGLAALSSDEAMLAFAVPDNVDFEDLSLTVAQVDSIPLVVPLTGAMTGEPWPVAVPASGAGPVQGGAHGCNQTLAVEVLDASVSIDLLDTEKYPTAYGQRRALVGDRFLTVETLITNRGGSRCGGGASNIDSNNVRLYVDGRPTAPITPVAMALPPNVSEDVVWHFAYPVAATELKLVFGTEDGITLEVPVDISATSDL